MCLGIAASETCPAAVLLSVRGAGTSDGGDAACQFAGGLGGTRAGADSIGGTGGGNADCC
jgi:hypothetical protein